MASNITHSAPAGTLYGDIFDAGNDNLHRHAGNFPIVNNSAILPPIYTSKYTERVDVATNKPVMRADLQNPTTSKQQKDREAYEGLVGNHAGSEAERIVFEKLNNIEKKQSKLTSRLSYSCPKCWCHHHRSEANR